jgi:predicted GIY-YIG superfamily endonuclease
MPVVCSTSIITQSMTLLLTNLKNYRQLRSISDKIPLYCVFGDTVIRSIVRDRPSSVLQLQSIAGLDPDKCRLYGQDIVQIVNSTKEAKPTPPVVVRHASKGAPWSRRRATVKPLDMHQVNTATKRIPGIPAGKEGVYILELAEGRVYVGHSTDMKRRIQQHMSGQGAAFTKAFPPTGVMLPRLGCVTGSPEAAERDETLRYMFLRGIHHVRGWKYVQVQMSVKDEDDAEENIRELFDLCRRCGHPGHFVTHCKANFDRRGKPCRR